MLQEATEALKPILGEWYKRDERPILKACWEDWSLCRWGTALDSSNIRYRSWLHNLACIGMLAGRNQPQALCPAGMCPPNTPPSIHLLLLLHSGAAPG